MKRYLVVIDEEYLEMTHIPITKSKETEDGLYVLYEDHLKAMEAQRNACVKAFKDEEHDGLYTHDDVVEAILSATTEE